MPPRPRVVVLARVADLAFFIEARRALRPRSKTMPVVALAWDVEYEGYRG